MLTEKKRRRKRKEITKKQRAGIIKKLIVKYGLRCWYCGKELSYAEVRIDHIVPVSRKGSDDIWNFALACEFCNSHKFYHSVEYFLKYLAYIRSGNFTCPVLREYSKGLEPTEKDALQKSYY